MMIMYIFESRKSFVYDEILWQTALSYTNDLICDEICDFIYDEILWQTAMISWNIMTNANMYIYIYIYVY